MDKDNLVISGCIINSISLLLGPIGFIVLVGRYRTTFVAPLELLLLVPVGLLVLLRVYSTISRGKYIFAAFLWSAPLNLISLILALVLLCTHSPLLMPPEGAMTATHFRYNSFLISKGEQIFFFNPTNGKAQVLCVGENGTCEQCDKTCPKELTGSGLPIKPGQTISVTFSNSRDYSITSITTPQMNMTIGVTDGNLDGVQPPDIYNPSAGGN